MNPLKRVRRCLGICSSLLLTMSGCGGGSGGVAGMASQPPSPQSCGGSSCGGAMLTMTDAQGDFTNYAVTVTSIQLKKANGAAVETLPKSTTIDFAQLVDLSEVLSVGQIPAGEYVGASIAVDYTSATLIVDDGSATGLKVLPVDKDGNPISQLTLDVQLDNKNHLVIAPNRISRLAFDFNLLASNTVDTTTAKVTVQPFVVASVMPTDSKKTRVRGALTSVDEANSDYVVNVAPFHMASSATNGQVTVHTTADTTYEINGKAYQGTAGLTALAALPTGAMTAAFGSLQISDMTFTAANILAGTSLENENIDHLTGNVVGRSGNTLTIRGVEIGRHDGAFEFGGGNVSVTVGSNTIVTEEGQSGSFDISAISVGQRIDVFGVESINSMNQSTVNGKGTTFDATAGRVRLVITPIWGVVKNTTAATSTGSGSVALNLMAIDTRPASAYDFTGTGKTTADDAQSSNYVVNTQSLPLAGLALNAPTRMFGFVTSFGSAPPDFNAMTLVDFSAVRAELDIGWGLKGTTAPFTTESNAQLVLDLSNPNIGVEHVIEVGPMRIDLKSLTSSPMIVPDATSSMQLYSIGHVATHKIENFNTFADFATALSSALNGSTLVDRLAASGSFNSVTNTFTADHLIVVVNN